MNLKNIERKDGWVIYYYIFDYGYGYDFIIKYIESLLKTDQFRVDRILKAEMANSSSVNCTEEFFKVNDIRKMPSLQFECGRITLAGFSKKLNSLPIQISLYNQTNYLKIEHPEMNVMPSKDEMTEYVSYIEGEVMNNTDKFEEMSIEELKECAKENNIEAIYYLGRAYYWGKGVEKDYKKAKEYFEECAKENDIDAIYYLGRMYYWGEGVEKDYKKAREYFERCLNENHISATHYLGLIYYFGKGVEEDYKKAKECFKKGADNGNLDSKYHLARILYEEKEYNEARIIFEELAKKDDVEVIHYLGKMYYYGEGVEKDYKKAKDYFVKCCNINGHIDSLYLLGMMAYNGYGMKQDYVLARESFELCSEKGHVQATHFLGDIYATGKGIEKNMIKAKEYFEKCAEKNHLFSIYNLGLMYYYGEGVEENLEKAKEYFEICVKKNNIDLIMSIAKLYEKAEANYYYEIVEKKVLDIVFNMLLILIKYDIKEQNCPYKAKLEENLLKIINTLNKDNEWIIMNDLGKLEFTSISKFLDKKLLNDFSQICDLNSKDYNIIKERLIKKVNEYLENKKIEEKDLENTEKIIKEIIDNKI